MHYQNIEDKKYSSPLFKYSYNSDRKVIEQNTGDNFLGIQTIWEVPLPSDDKAAKTATSTGYLKSSLPISDIIDAIMNDQDIRGNMLNPYDPNARGYVNCEILGSLSEQQATTSSVLTFPIGVITKYLVKGDAVDGGSLLRTNYDLLILRDFSTGPIQILTIPNVSESFLSRFLLVNGSNELSRIINLDHFDKNRQYLNSEGICNQTMTSVILMPLKEF